MIYIENYINYINIFYYCIVLLLYVAYYYCIDMYVIIVSMGLYEYVICVDSNFECVQENETIYVRNLYVVLI